MHVALGWTMETMNNLVVRLRGNWPYFLVLIPILAAWICDRQVPSNLRIAVTNALSGLLTLALVMIIQKQRRLLEDVSVTDKLTGVFNSRCLRLELDRNVLLSHRTRQPLSLIFLDVDNLKSLNDRRGHMAGNIVLRTLGQCLNARVRQHMDLCFRFGGDEFLVLCPQADLETARAIAERILDIPNGEAALREERITLSLGLIQLREGESAAAFLKRADRVMYSVKRAGKNAIGLDLDFLRAVPAPA